MSKTNEKKAPLNPIASIYEWVEVICVALFFVVLLFTFVCRLVTVEGESMEHTFYGGDRLIISDIMYEPKLGDVVVVQNVTDPNFHGPIIKRVIATEGETVNVDSENWTITVTHKDGSVTTLSDEAYVNRVEGYMRPGYVRYPHTVEDGHIFVMGDNRNHSYDSRFCGDIDERMILGKVYVRLLPNPAVDFSK